MPELDWTQDGLIGAEAWLLAKIREQVDALPSNAAIPAGNRRHRKWTVEPGPGEWSDAYLARILKSLPAAIVAWRGGDAGERGNLAVGSEWSVYVATGWNTGQKRSLRTAGAWYAVRRIAPELHNATVFHYPAGDTEPPQRIPGLGRARVMAIRNLWSGDIDKQGMALFQVVVDIPMALEPAIDADFLDLDEVGVAWGFEGAAVTIDDAHAVPGTDPELGVGQHFELGGDNA